ncbi:MAG: hypothetical protein KY455_04465 [Euryarchaeota archaeon]|nr:hypothetical protein [Euryarchaeota archaeon]
MDDEDDERTPGHTAASVEGPPLWSAWRAQDTHGAPGATTETFPLGLPVLSGADGAPAGTTTLLEVGHMWSLLRHRMVLEAYHRGLPVLQLVGGHRLDPYGLARAARAAGEDAEEVLGHAQAARAFTVHQLSAFVEEELPRRLSGPALVVLSDPLALYAGGEVEEEEGRRLLRRALRRFVRAVAAAGAYGVVAERPFARDDAGRELLRLARHVQVRPADGGIVADVVHSKRRLLQPTARPQARLADYGVQDLGPSLVALPEPVATVRGPHFMTGRVGHLKVLAEGI